MTGSEVTASSEASANGNPHLDIPKLAETYNTAQNRYFFLDYDGTLSPIRVKPEDATPSDELLKLLKELAEDQKNHIYIISGRDRKFLVQWVGKLRIGLSAEHGAFLRPPPSSGDKVDEWRDLISEQKMDVGWKDDVNKMFDDFVKNTPKSEVERKEYAITLHYRQSDKNDYKPHLETLKSSLSTLSDKYPTLDVRKGKKSLEARVKGVTKGVVINEILNTQGRNGIDFVMCLGDDTTDEDMFEQLAKEKSLKNVCTCNVGKKVKTVANAHTRTQDEVMDILRTLAKSNKQ